MSRRDRHKWDRFQPEAAPRVTEMLMPFSFIRNADDMERIAGLVQTIMNCSTTMPEQGVEASKTITARLVDHWYRDNDQVQALFIDTITYCAYGVSSVFVENEQFGYRVGEIAEPIQCALAHIYFEIGNLEAPDCHGVDETDWKMRNGFAVRVGHYLARRGDSGVPEILAHADFSR